MNPVLLLNIDYRPLDVISWRRAVELLMRDVAERVEAYTGKMIRSPSRAIPFPAVLRLTKGYQRRSVRLSRKNIVARDAYTCQYCGARPRKSSGAPRLEDLTIDHVVPRSRAVHGHVRLPWDGHRRARVGSWENVLTACVSCNGRKADRTPGEAGMSMRRIPGKPSHLDMVWMALFSVDIPSEWKLYLPENSPWGGYWDDELEEF